MRFNVFHLGNFTCDFSHGKCHNLRNYLVLIILCLSYACMSSQDTIKAHAYNYYSLGFICFFVFLNIIVFQLE